MIYIQTVLLNNHLIGMYEFIVVHLTSYVLI